MNTPSRRSYGSRLAVLASLALVSGGSLLAEGEARADVPPGILKKYDKNKDGALDETELARWEADKAARREKERKAREERLQKYDLNKDGKLSEDEKAAAKLAMEKERTEREMAKGREKAQERLAREKAEKEKSEAAAAADSSEMASEKTPKEGEAKAEDGMMMTQ
jgi:hypothetical protein